MNFGNTILELRKKKNITQEELASELGVTAAAVSKWENNYTLPDILMLCALADYFEVTTDELLGRNTNWQYAVIAAESLELGQSIAELSKRYGILARQIHTKYLAAVDAAQSDDSVKYLLVGYHHALTHEQWDANCNDLYICQCIDSNDTNILLSLELMLKKFTF